MSPRLIGQIGCCSPSSPIPDTPATRTAWFEHGFLTSDAEGSVFDEQGVLCVAVGAPRFIDPALAALARERGDTVAWVEAFTRHGTQAPSTARGRFGVVMLVPSRNEAWLATDRFATWPICYALQDGGLRFSNRADTVPGGPHALSSQSIFDYLFFHMIPAPATIFENVARLPGGHVLKWANGEAQLVRWWQSKFDEQSSPDFPAAKHRFLDLVEKAVAREANSAQVATFLSGGTDSSTVSGMLCRILGQPASSYSIGFDAQGYDEMEYARIAARHFGTKHHEYYVTAPDLLAAIPRVAAHYDQPFGNSSAVPAWICATRAREDGVEKMLAGDGGDELFGGNTRYAKQRLFGWYDTVPGLVRRGLIQPALALPGIRGVPLLRKGVSYVEQARVPMPDRMHMYNMLLRLGCDQIFEPAFLARIDTCAPSAMQRATWQETGSASLINRMLAYDWKYTLADNDLPKVIGTTQLAGLDVAFPLLDDELLDFSTKLPSNWKLNRLTLRWFFKEALRGFLPDAILAKKKHGFGLPFGIWVCRHAPLRALATDALGSFGKRGIVRSRFIHDLLEVHLPAHPGYFGEMVWILMMMEFWLRAHEDEYA